MGNIKDAVTVGSVTSETTESLEERMTKALCSYHIGLDGVNESEKPFKYVMTKDGIMKIMKNKIGLFASKTDEVPGLPSIKEGVVLSIPKIPYYMFQQVISFFRAVMKTKGGAEAMVQFYYDEENDKFIMNCPDQTVSGASVNFKRDQDLDKKYTLVMDIHSH